MVPTRALDDPPRAATKPDTPRVPPPPLRTRHRSSRTPAWVFGVLALFAVALAAIVIGLASGGDDDAPDRAANKPADSKKQQSEQQQEPAAEDTPIPQDEPAEEPAAASPAPIKGVPQPKGKGTIDEAHALQDQGFTALQGGDYKTAIKLSKQAIEAFPPGTTDPQYAYALFNLGQALRLDGHPDQAIPVLETRLAIPNQTATVEEELEAARAAAGEQ